MWVVAKPGALITNSYGAVASAVNGPHMPLVPIVLRCAAAPRRAPLAASTA